MGRAGEAEPGAERWRCHADICMAPATMATAGCSVACCVGAGRNHPNSTEEKQGVK